MWKPALQVKVCGRLQVFQPFRLVRGQTAGDAFINESTPLPIDLRPFFGSYGMRGNYQTRSSNMLSMIPPSPYSSSVVSLANSPAVNGRNRGVASVAANEAF